jgi:hypothetical protein
MTLSLRTGKPKAPASPVRGPRAPPVAPAAHTDEQLPVPEELHFKPALDEPPLVSTAETHESLKGPDPPILERKVGVRVSKSVGQRHTASRTGCAHRMCLRVQTVHTAPPQ